jgi:hypothetical protein
MLKQPDYNKKSKKRQHQLTLFKKAINKDNFIGLCGPTPKGYLRQIKTAGFKNAILVDNDSVYLNQNIQVFRDFNKKLGVSAQCGDINKMLNKNAFYDLDYCNSIMKLSPVLDKIMKIKEFCLTVALRPISEEKTLGILNKYNRTFLPRVYREDGIPMMICYFPPLKK